MIRIYGSLVILLVYFLISSCKTTRLAGNADPIVQFELGGGAGHYTYAPSAIQDEFGIRYMYLCQNKNPFEIVDYLYLYKGIPTTKGYVWQKGTEVMAPSTAGWDK